MRCLLQILSIKAQINLWGVGTHLVTGKDQPALDGVYKLSALQNSCGLWEDKLKISEQPAKITTPGILQVRRFHDDKGNIADMIYDVRFKISSPIRIVDPLNPASSRELASSTSFEDLLVPVMRSGTCIASFPILSSVRARTEKELSRFHPAIRRFLNPRPYFSGLESSLYAYQEKLISHLSN